MAELSIIGMNHKTAPVALREQWALNRDHALALLHQIHAENTLEEALVLSTCNRAEVYFVSRKADEALDYLAGHVARLRQAAPVTDRSVFYRHDGPDAVRHLYRVAASLDSLIVGEHQILGQVKEAYRLALEARTAGFLLNRLLHGAFRVGKRVMTETEIGRGSAGVAQAAIELARHIFTSLEGRSVLLVGAGQNAECAAQALLRAGATRLIVANRTLSRAQQLAHDILQPTREACAPEGPGCEPPDEADGPVACPAVQRRGDAGEEIEEDAAPPVSAPSAAPTAEGIGLEDLPRAIASVDLVISSTGAPEPVLKYDALAPALARRARPLLMIDIAVPRDIDERLATLSEVFLYNIDDLDRLVAHNLERRRGEIPRAEKIVQAEVEEFGQWLASRQVAPTLRLLQKYMETLQQEQIRRYGGQFTDADRRKLEEFTRALGQKMLHRPMTLLRDVAKDGPLSENVALVDMIHRLFDLDSIKDEGGDS